MDFIERWFHVSPDNGSGSTELMYIVAIAVLVIATIRRRQLASFVKRCANRFRKKN
jgi:Sec-independent protein translocase protein TatA